jgi:hypothetical protein
MRFGTLMSLQLAALLVSVATVSYATSPTGNDYLVPQLVVGQTYSNVFSIMRSVKTNGYDEHAGRNGGSADYTVVASAMGAWRFRESVRYDGSASGGAETELRDGGRTDCHIKDNAEVDCSAYLEASGPIYNPTLWGVPPQKLIEGMSWKVVLKQPWEMGGLDGTQTVTVIRVDPIAHSVTLMREGSAQGAFNPDATTISLTHEGKNEPFDIIPGTSHWKGYTTFVKGVVYSDELTVTRDDVLRDKQGKTFNAMERRIMLLNAAPFPTL